MIYDTAIPDEHRSFLIDAGASCHGYASDITRTYAKQAGAFADLITEVDALTLALIDELKPGVPYPVLQTKAHEGIGRILQQAGIVNMSAEDCVAEGITKTFFPHGIGHFLGLQVHDVGGLVSDDRGTPCPAPDDHPFLRCTRTVEAQQVFTVEPGLYFIESLLADLKASEQSKFINWDTVAAFKPFGGIRIEDNVVVHRDRNENMTREAGLN